jgi:hypothetical protein
MKVEINKQKGGNPATICHSHNIHSFLVAGIKNDCKERKP